MRVGDQVKVVKGLGVGARGRIVGIHADGRDVFADIAVDFGDVVKLYAREALQVCGLSAMREAIDDGQ